MYVNINFSAILNHFLITFDTLGLSQFISEPGWSFWVNEGLTRSLLDIFMVICHWEPRMENIVEHWWRTLWKLGRRPFQNMGGEHAETMDEDQSGTLVENILEPLMENISKKKGTFEKTGGSRNFGRRLIIQKNVNSRKKGTFEKSGGNLNFRPNVNIPEKR